MEYEQVETAINALHTLCARASESSIELQQHVERRKTEYYRTKHINYALMEGIEKAAQDEIAFIAEISKASKHAAICECLGVQEKKMDQRVVA